jgi:hypothetical protein
MHIPNERAKMHKPLCIYQIRAQKCINHYAYHNQNAYTNDALNKQLMKEFTFSHIAHIFFYTQCKRSINHKRYFSPPFCLQQKVVKVEKDISPYLFYLSSPSMKYTLQLMEQNCYLTKIDL